MPSPGERELVRSESASDLLHGARKLELEGCPPEAMEEYRRAIAAAERSGEAAVLAEALRRLAVLHHHRDEFDRAHALCRLSYEAARAAGLDLLAAEALNTQGGLHLTRGTLDEARRAFLDALELGAGQDELLARVEQNLGILANIQGDLNEALSRYEHSLAAYADAGNLHGCALAYHNLGMVRADQGMYEEADRRFGESRVLAELLGDNYLQGQSLISHAEVDVARQRFENARQNAEAALALFDQLGAGAPKADAYRVLGMVYRETGRPALAESRLRAAIELATRTGSVLSQAEAVRELALLHRTKGRNGEALRLLNDAYRLFRRLDARLDLTHVGGKLAELESSFRAVVRDWGHSIESSDRFTFGHCERVAQYAVATAQALGLGEHQETTILLGGYLHDLGMVRVPHEIVGKPGPLTEAEREVVRMHPIWGVELLANVEFPWELKPIIRWHHEHYDGSGYPDRLQGDTIPIAAQIVGIAEVFDAMTASRSYQTAVPFDGALERIAHQRRWWSDRVVEAFLRAVAIEAVTRGRQGERTPPCGGA